MAHAESVLREFGASVQRTGVQLAPVPALQGPSLAMNVGQVVALPTKAEQAYGTVHPVVPVQTQFRFGPGLVVALYKVAKVDGNQVSQPALVVIVVGALAHVTFEHAAAVAAVMAVATD